MERGGTASFDREPDNLRTALPETAFETVEEVEGLLAEVGRDAPETLAAPVLEALTSGGKRLRPLLLVLSARIGDPDREALLGAWTAIEILHKATLIHDDIVDSAENRRGRPSTGGR